MYQTFIRHFRRRSVMPSPVLPKFMQLSQSLEEGIASGMYRTNGKLPSVRGLAQKHQVALATAARALEVLHGKGLIRRDERNGGYFVAPKTEGIETWAFCFRVTPGPMEEASRTRTAGGFQAAAQERGESVILDALRFDERATTIASQVKALTERPIHGLFLMPSRLDDVSLQQDEELLAACDANGVPVVLLERNLRGDGRPLERDLVAVDDVAGGYACTRHLLDLGKQRIGFVRGGPTSSHNDRLAGYLQALWLHRLAGVETPPFVLSHPDLPARDAYRALVEQILDERLDGLVCFSDILVLGLTLELMVRGKRVPDDLAMTGFDDQPLGSAFSLGVTTYAYPGEKMAVEAFRLMRERRKEPQREPIKVVAAGRLLVRESTVGNVIHRAS
jgi:LacI family transcriptional regulator